MCGRVGTNTGLAPRPREPHGEVLKPPITRAHIDWILARGPIVPRSFRLIDTELDGQRPSDHFPLSATVELAG